MQEEISMTRWKNWLTLRTRTDAHNPGRRQWFEVEGSQVIGALVPTGKKGTTPSPGSQHTPVSTSYRVSRAGTSGLRSISDWLKALDNDSSNTKQRGGGTGASQWGAAKRPCPVFNSR